ncbi:MAG: glycine--tRNA ligase subunit beta [Microcoleus sp. PH2017_10_PVI_O_A]|uniref:glycine--tRNA ligase subunit beta n=1 Tax=unclassified Microcoleus TaxID=2642155 RepID=UPI001DB09672|nr:MULTISPECIES: glycine--tRNA ligase subunit beta [unclassified Microcoleus]TAE74110.1 MAG: glycine--tRNA ligase subunit beta [Oscillatoriales cyanobacterium]MCC3409233.1 glycine--tRNA ligase subunit beta [Microcoleus sp. PH2017_10_PVI_O_A]MCC3463472.1 glycine--tRNA ligase subunit beta [Microcoleus sp. PH2017_11_PCY_U_A]MCC3481814.1 glycine--tRNA ligase subunit beta [Microcoleus sp. PH2017_12_PCY_D_A]MCC3531571.1 glycine--tRNA ligase subunit beta [Microcoleus sp. PH2017_21_RUC_O_A]
MPNFLLELGTEELPASFVAGSVQQWQELVPATLAEQSLTNESINVYATPRRLAVLVKGLPLKQLDREEEVKGPPASSAFKDGKPTKAAEGFAKKQGVEIDALEVRATDKGDFVFVLKQIPGRMTADILAELVPQWINKLEGKRFMRWADGDLKFPRPIRSIVALFDDTVLPIALVSGSDTVKSDRISQGHRVLHTPPTPPLGKGETSLSTPPLTKGGTGGVSIPQAEDYVECLRAAGVEVDRQQRKTQIKAQVEAAAAKQGGYADITEDLLEEVTDLVEWPNAVVGKFDEEFLILPPEVITTIIVTNQRYFPILKSPDFPELLPYFITISNGDPAKSAIIAAGNERVVRARLADGQFFYKADLVKPLEDYLPKLETVTFQEDLGTVRAKVDRLCKIASLITKQLQITAAEQAYIERAALLCKADLVTQMVYELPEMQGIMGQKYALACGEPEAVATAIFEHYLPKGAGDNLPQTLTGQVVAIADKLDTLVSIFGLGMLPTGSSDPFALRRAANAIVNIIWTAELSVNLHQLLAEVVAEFTAIRPQTSPELLSQLSEFFLQRIRTLLEEEGQLDYDVVNAVLGENDPEYTERALRDLLDTLERALFLQQIRNDKTLDKIYETVNRSTRLAAQGDLDKVELEPKTAVKPELFQKSSEQALYDALVQLVPQTLLSKQTRNYQQLVESLTEIAPAVSSFFDGPESVLVMDSDPEIKRNRLNLLGLLRNHARVLADFGAIVNRF